MELIKGILLPIRAEYLVRILNGEKTYFENEDAICWQTRKIRSQMLILIERTRFLAVMESILKKHRKNRYQKLNKHLDKITKQIEKEKEEDKAFQELVKELETDELI